jgi:hypothetical protein
VVSEDGGRVDIIFAKLTIYATDIKSGDKLFPSESSGIGVGIVPAFNSRGLTTLFTIARRG